jgi:hypothetical protein
MTEPKRPFVVIVPDYQPLLLPILIFWLAASYMTLALLVLYHVNPGYVADWFMALKMFMFTSWMAMILVLLSVFGALFSVIAKKKEWVLRYSDLEAERV